MHRVKLNYHIIIHLNDLHIVHLILKYLKFICWKWIIHVVEMDEDNVKYNESLNVINVFSDGRNYSF